MGISARRISYGWGWGSTRTSADLDEGAPVLKGEVVEPQKIIDGTTAPTVARGEPGILSNYYDIGGIYYMIEPALAWSPSWAVKTLDALFEDTVAGAGPGYNRTYYMTDVPAEATTFVTWAKRIAKAGHDYAEVLSGGIVRGFTLRQAAPAPVVFIPQLCFPFYDEASASFPEASASWDIATTGDVDPWMSAETLLAIGTVGGAPWLAKLRGWRLTVSYSVNPNFYASQDADRITRDRLAIDGEIHIRDVGDDVETLEGYLAAGTTITVSIYQAGSSQVLQFNCKIHAGGGAEDDVTRLGHYQLTGVEATEHASYEWPIKFTVSPERS